MLFFASGMMFDNSMYSKGRKFNDPFEMNNCIISRWNKVVCDTDSVVILGGIGEFEYLKDLNGKKSLMMDVRDMSFYQSYIYAITNVRDETYDQEMFETYVKEAYKIDKVIFNRKIVRKLYSGRLVSITNDIFSFKDRDKLNIFSNADDSVRIIDNGINVELSMNYMTPMSEVEIEYLLKKDLSILEI